MITKNTTIQPRKSLANNTKWKSDFYKAYRAGKYSTADCIYFTKHPYRYGMMDVHEAYRYEKRLDKDILLLSLVFGVVLFMFGYLIVL